MSRSLLERRPDALSDQRLADRARRGGEAAFAAIVARYHAPLLGVARRLRCDGRAELALGSGGARWDKVELLSAGEDS